MDAYGREGMKSLAARRTDAFSAYRDEKWMDGGAKCPWPKPKAKPCPRCAALVGNEKCDSHRRKGKARSYKIAPTTREFIYERDGFKCVGCGSREDLTIDHIVPRSKGGSNRRENLQTMCRACNQAKGSIVGRQLAA